jgi:hypothetical protein
MESLSVHSFDKSGSRTINLDLLLRVQSLLIDLARHLMDYADHVDESVRNLYFRTLILIFQREELDLFYMGFSNN